MNSFIQDLRYCARMLGKSRLFTVVAVVSIALGVGANATVFSWMRAVLLHPIPGVERGDELVVLQTTTPSGEFIDSSYPDFRDYRDRVSSLAGAVAFQERPLTLGTGAGSRPVWAQIVSGNFFDVLGMRASIGRTFSDEEQAETPAAHPVVVLGDRMWRHEYDADPAIVGQTVLLNRQPFTVVGVAPPDFHGTVVGLSFDLWVPLTMQGSLTGGPNWLEHRRSRPLHLMARLAPGVSVDAARAEVRTVAAQLAAAYPDSNAGMGATLLPLSEAPFGAQARLGTLLRILTGIGALVLLVVCANIANLLLARASTRRMEIGVRLALGASRRRIVRQLLTESLLLAAVGGGGGVLVAFWATDLLRLFVPATNLPVALSSPIEGEVIAFAVGVSIVTGIVFGLVPALMATRQDLHASLKEGSKQSSSGTGVRRLQRLFVVAEVALALVALVGAGLFVKSLGNAQKADPGFTPDRVVLVALDLSSSGYDRDQGRGYYRRLGERLETLPGVEAVSFAEDVPLGFEGGSWEDVRVDGYLPGPNETMKIYRNLVTPGYFDLMGIPLLDGRDFDDGDQRGAPPVVIVNETFARRFLAGQHPVGRQITGWGRQLTIVGVARDIKYARLDETPQPYLYVPFDQFYRADTGVAVHVRATAEPQTALAMVEAEIRAVDPSVAIFAAMPMRDYIAASVFMQKTAAGVLSVLAAVAVLLATLGLYGVMAYSSAQRRREVGIRLALGARPRDVVRLLVLDGLGLALVGVLVGLALSFGMARVTSSLLFGLSATDPGTFAWVVMLIGGVGIVASFIPARRASRIDPSVALREE